MWTLSTPYRRGGISYWGVRPGLYLSTSARFQGREVNRMHLLNKYFSCTLPASLNHRGKPVMRHGGLRPLGYQPSATTTKVDQDDDDSVTYLSEIVAVAKEIEHSERQNRDNGIFLIENTEAISEINDSTYSIGKPVISVKNTRLKNANTNTQKHKQTERRFKKQMKKKKKHWGQQSTAPNCSPQDGQDCFHPRVQLPQIKTGSQLNKLIRQHRAAVLKPLLYQEPTSRMQLNQTVDSALIICGRVDKTTWSQTQAEVTISEETLTGSHMCDKKQMPQPENKGNTNAGEVPREQSQTKTSTCPRGSTDTTTTSVFITDLSVKEISMLTTAFEKSPGCALPDSDSEDKKVTKKSM